MKRDEIYVWQTLLSTEDGKPERPASTFTFDIPTGLYVEKDKCERSYCNKVGCDFYCWKLKWNRTISQHKTVSPSHELLIEFVSLANEIPPQDFARKVELFAQKWGNLDICEEHQMPASHNENCAPSIPHKKVILRPVSSSVLSDENKIYCEDLATWHHYAVFAQSILNIAANHQMDRLGNDKDWQNLHKVGFIGWSHVERKKEKEYRNNLREFEHKLIADAVNYWLALGNLRPEVRWQNEQIFIVFKSASSYGSLFANLALQMMLLVGRQDGLAICSSCGTPFVPKRKPVKNKRSFCLHCRDFGKPQALASANYRKKKKAG